MVKSRVILIILLGITLFGYSQEPNDCINATAICGDIDFTYTPTGPGNNDFSTNPNPPCLPGTVESQSVWLQLTVDSGGVLEFAFTPNNGTDDYDWAVYDMSTSTCSNLGTPIRCSSTAFIAGTGGATGLGNGATDTNEGPGTGDGFLAPINVNSGDVYMVFINNWSSTSSGFDLTFGGTATFNPPPVDAIPTGVSVDLEECDNDGTIDGLTNFDLSVNTPIIIGAQSGISVTYHTTEGNAQIGANDIPDFTNFQNTIAGGQKIFVRVTNTGTDCFSITDFEVNVLDGLPTFTAPKINECDDNNDGLWDFDLTQSDATIINGEPNLQVSYHLTQDNARNDAMPIIGLHPNAGNPQALWARLESTVNTCFQVARFEIEVYDTPTAIQPSNISQCDDDNNGTMPFILTNQDVIINTIAGMSVTYYLSQAEADSGTSGALSSPFESASTTIYARVENDANTPCFDTISFDLEVYDSAVPSTSVTLLGECDNTSVGTDIDGFIEFNLHDRATEILNGQAAADFTLTYFIDAYITQIPVADETAFTNTIAGGQTIFVRMANNANTNCFTDTSFEIEVYELPVLLTPTVTLILCNDDLTLIEEFNLRLKEDEVSANFAIETFTYFETFAQADAGVAGTEIATPTTYPNQVAGFDTVWVRIETTNGCHRVAEVNLDVNPSSSVMNGFLIREFSQCDDGSNNRDGIATFDFSSVTTDIETLFSPLVVDVLYYETEVQANQGLVVDQIDATDYDNVSQDQLIWVQIVSDFGSDCLAKGQYIQLHVEELPTANTPTTIMKECDDDGDGAFPFDVSIITSEILNGQSLADVTITYFNEDGTPITGVVNSSLPNPFSTTSQTIEIVVTNNNTNDTDGACSDLTTIEFIVDASPTNSVQPIPAECETDPDDGFLIATFDTSNLESSINAQAGMDITYLDSNGDPLEDMDGNLIVSPFPNSFITGAQTITVVVTNPANTSCPAAQDVDFTVNPRPLFDDVDDQVVCNNILPHIITAENPDANNYNYEWFNSNGISIGADQTLSIIDATDISITGVEYSVTVTNPATGCDREKTFNLKKSSNATLLDSDLVTVEFNSPTNSIEIITANLGFGDFEFALQHDADSRPWQDEPIFTDLQGGVYTVLISDKNGCGEISKVIFLLDYPKFLTPNNDGYNDYWQLIGLDSARFTISPIQIFDRFGKIVAIIDPIQGQGWEGLYNNEMLPSTDYWFALSLTDSQGQNFVKKGNFSLVRK